MIDLFVKLKILYYHLSDAYRQWKEYVWDKDLDVPYCCSGRECFCGGVTIRQLYSD